jgi:hypothetical protein
MWADETATDWLAIQWTDSASSMRHIDVRSGSNSSQVTLTAPADETWGFWAITRDTDGNLTGYFGAESGTTLTAGSQTGSLQAAEFTAIGMAIGADRTGAGLDADVALVRIWESVLSQSEFESEMVSATAVKTASLWAEYRFADGALTTDSGGNSRTLTATGTPTYVADPTITVTGQFARPSSDVADGNWLNASSSNTNLYASIDEETAADADYIRSGATPSSDTCTVGLSSISTPESGTVTMRIRARYV